MASKNQSLLRVNGDSACPAAGHQGGEVMYKMEENESAVNVETSKPTSLQCFVVGCPSSSSNAHGRKVFFRLPAEKDRCQQWLKICKREDLIGEPMSFINNYVICSDHFIKDHFKDASKTALKDLAVPTIFDTTYNYEMELEDGSDGIVEYEVAETDEECVDADDEIDGQQLCRLCGFHSHDVIYIFSSKGNKLNLARNINSILPITVDSSDHLPKQVCLSCLVKLDTSKDLFDTCLKTDEYLKTFARKKLFRSHLYIKDTQTCPTNFLENCKMENVGHIGIRTEHQNLPSTNHHTENVTSGGINNEKIITESYTCPFNCGGVMFLKNFTGDDNEHVLEKDNEIRYENMATFADEAEDILAPQDSMAGTGVLQSSVCEVRDSRSHKYTVSEPLPEWWHKGNNMDNLEIIIHTLDPNFKLDDDEACEEIYKGTEDNGVKTYQMCNETSRNLSEHSKGHAISTCVCTLCMVCFNSPVELENHMVGHTGNDKKMTKIAGSRRFGCSICLRKFNNERTWRQHSCKPSDYKPVQCPVCRKAFQTEERLSFHQKFHNGAKPNYCEKCCKHFDNESLLYYHCSLIHEKDRPFSCSVCKKRFFSNTRLVTHMRVHTGDRPYECKECTSRFSDHETLKRHRVTHASVKPFQCELCGILCARKSLLRQHIQLHHLTPDHLKRGHSLIHYYCKLCNKTFTGSRDVLTHKDTHWHVDKRSTCELGAEGSATPLICEFCAESFSDLSVLVRHRKECHIDEKPYICSVCKLASRTLHEARVHRRTHTIVNGDSKLSSRVTTKENTFVCEECGMQISGGCNLRAHMKLHKQAASHKCGKCSRTFSNKRRLILHSRLHSGEKPFVCQQCGKHFSQSSALHVHILLHTGEKPHSCDLCGATFRIKADRDNHRRTHTGEKPYRCEYCFKEFRTGQVYYQHRMIHTGERRFPCDVCGKAFKRSHTLVVHKRIHTGEKPNICDVCGKGFRQRTDMRKHRALHAHR